MTGQYTNLAAFYDLLNDGVDYDAWFAFLQAAFAREEVHPNSVLDLACGTGAMALRFARQGYDTTAVDLSTEMLSMARLKADKEGLDILFLNQDMAQLELYGAVDAAVCCLDSINYLATLSDVAACFDRVCNYLNPGGIFIFDINSEYKFENIYADNAYVFEKQDVFCTWQNYYSRSSKMCTFYLDFFVHENGLYRRMSETQRERCYSLRQILKQLKQAGFSKAQVFSDFDFEPVDQNNQGETERFYIVCRKM